MNQTNTEEFKFERIISEPEIVRNIIDDHSSTLKYCPSKKHWYIFDHLRWVKTKDQDLITQMVRETLDRYYQKHAPGLSLKEKKKLFSVVTSFKSFRGSKKLLDTTKTYQTIQINGDSFDTHPELLVAENGTVDLSSGELRDSHPEDYMTRKTATAYISSQSCPKFEKFLDDITNNSKELKEYILMILGYCITGLSTEQNIYIFYGLGANGKSLLIETVREVIGTELVVNISAKTLMKNTVALREDVARLEGARLLTCGEINDGEILDESMVKGITGGDKITGRPLYSGSIEFKNTGKIIALTNYMFEIKGVDYGIIRRLKIVPFNATFTGKDDNKNLKSILLKEREGILALLVNYAVKYLKTQTIETPEEVARATTNYLNSCNSAKTFYNECVYKTENRKLWISIRRMYDSYVEYCDENCLKKVTPRELTNVFTILGAEKGKSGSVRFWKYLAVNSATSITNNLTPPSQTDDTFTTTHGSPFTMNSTVASTPEIVGTTEEENPDQQDQDEYLETESPAPSLTTSEGSPNNTESKIAENI